MRKIILNSKRGDDICPECYNLGTLRGINTSRKGIESKVYTCCMCGCRWRVE